MVLSNFIIVVYLQNKYLPDLGKYNMTFNLFSSAENKQMT